MAQLSISAAARAAGKDRGTINRYIKSGKLSTSKDASGSTVIETAELLRVFGSLKGDGSRGRDAAVAAPSVENSSMQHALEATLELLKQQLKASQDREARLLGMLELEQQSRRELEQRLLPPGKDVPGETPDQSDKEQTLVQESDSQVIETQAAPESIPLPEAAPSSEESGEEKQGFFSRLLRLGK